MERDKRYNPLEMAVESLLSGEGERRDKLLEWYSLNPPDPLSFPYAIEEIATDFGRKKESLRHIFSSVQKLTSQVLREEVDRRGVELDSLETVSKFYSGRENSSGSVSIDRDQFRIELGSNNILQDVRASARISGLRNKEVLLPASYRLGLSIEINEYDSGERHFRLLTGDHSEVLSVMLSEFYINYLRT